MKHKKLHTILLLIAMLIINNCFGGNSSKNKTEDDTTLQNTDRFHINFKYDLDSNGTPDFEDELKKRNLIQDRDSIITDMVDLLWERFDNNANRTLTATNPLKISFSSKKPYGVSVGSRQAYCTTPDQYNIILVVNCRTMQNPGTLGMNNLDDPSVNPSGGYNERIENNTYGTTTPLGVYIDHIGNSLANAGLFSKNLFIRVFATVAAHEIGHGIGLVHSSHPVRYIMDAAILLNNPATDFSPDDKTKLITSCLPGKNR